MTSWSCHRLRPDLVDFAEGTLAESRRTTVERHVGSCPECADSVLALREVPARLRRMASAEPSAEFWARQRASILDAIEYVPVSAAPIALRGTRTRAWKTGFAIAASLTAVVATSQWWSAGTPSPATLRPVVAAAPVQVASVTERRPTTAAASTWRTQTTTDNVLYVEDTSLLSLAEQLDDESSDGTGDSLI